MWARRLGLGPFLGYGLRRRRRGNRRSLAWWRLLRYFSLGEGSGARVGFLAQSPLGHGCTAIFDSVTYKPGAPADLRDGT